MPLNGTSTRIAMLRARRLYTLAALFFAGCVAIINAGFRELPAPPPARAAAPKGAAANSPDGGPS